MKIFREVGSAISEIHALGYIHRDVSEDNILIDNDYNIKLIDFGSIGNIDFAQGKLGTL